MKTLFLESIAGIAGDMFAASFIDAGLVTHNELQKLPDLLKINDIEIKVTEVIRSTMRGTHIEVIYDEHEWSQRFNKNNPSDHHHFHVPFRELERIIMDSTLDNHTKLLSTKILDKLADAESHCHGVSKDVVAFHELGMVDSLIDIVMAAYCISTVSPDTILASPVKLGRGLISTAHGTQPVPPPVSAALSTGMIISPIPNAITKKDIELSTPTGLAILKSLNPDFSQEWPAGKVLSQGNGAGTMDLEDYPNFFRVSLIESEKINAHLPYLKDTIIEISVNYDDSTSEHLSWATQKLFECGALDVWQTPAVGKKGRVLIVLSILVESSNLANCVDFLLKSTTTFGIRYQSISRMKLDRHFESRTNETGSFRFKIGCDTNGVKIKEKPEFDDVARSLDNMLNQ